MTHFKHLNIRTTDFLNDYNHRQIFVEAGNKKASDGAFRASNLIKHFRFLVLGSSIHSSALPRLAAL